MVAPLIPIALLATMLGGLGVSAGANLYTQNNNRRLWSQQAAAYENLDRGYRKYLATQGKEINPNRAWTSYFGSAQSLRNNIANSTAQSFGTLGGSAGAMAGFTSGGLYRVERAYNRRL